MFEKITKLFGAGEKSPAVWVSEKHLHHYSPAEAKDAETWSKTASVGVKTGSLIFWLQPVSQDKSTFSLNSLSIVIGNKNNAPLVLYAKKKVFEVRFLNVLMLELGRKAILDMKQLNYVIAEPTKPVDLEKLAKLAADHAEGTRKMQTNPLSSLLPPLGFELDEIQGANQIVDIDRVFEIVFTPKSNLLRFHLVPGNAS